MDCVILCIASARNVDAGLGEACRRGRLGETVNWTRLAQLRRARVSSHVRELEIRRSCSTLHRFYMTIRFKFLVVFVAINRPVYIRNILRNYRRADGHHPAT
jgi:hypothetical protein